MITRALPGGWLPAVAWFRGDVYWGVMVEHGPVAVYRLAGGVEAPVKVWEDPDATTNAYIRLAVWQDVLYAAYRIDRPFERARQAEFDGARWSAFDREPTAGNNPVAIGDGDFAQLHPGAGPFPVGRGALDGFALADAGTCPGTGLAYLTRDGFVTVDDNRASAPGMANPARSGALVVGELDKSGPLCFVDGAGGVLWAGTGEWINPACARAEDGRCAVTAWRADGSAARVSVLTADEVRALPPRPAVAIAVPRFGRPCWLLPYHATRHGQSVAVPGHAEIVTDGQDAAIRAVRRPVIADAASEATVDDLLAVFAAIDADDFARARAAADRRGVPLMAYWDHPSDIPVRSDLRPGWDWLSVMLYCDPAESLEAFRRRAHDQTARACGRGFRVVLTVQMFDRNGAEPDAGKLSAMQPLWRDLAEAHPDVVGIAPFAAIRGAHGVTAYPFLGEWLAAYAGAMVAPARPVPPPIEVPEMKLPDAVMAKVLEFAAVYPVPRGDGSEAWVDAALRKHWTRKLAETLCFYFGPDWGTKARDGGADTPASKEAVAWCKDGLHVWDMLIGAGSGSPALATDPTYYFVPDQHFIEVAPVDHINRVVASAVARPALPFMVAKSGFDWHIHRDMAWLEQQRREGIPTLRLVAHSVFRDSGAVAPEEAIRRLRLGLEILRAEGMTAAVTFHADTRERGDTKETVIARTVRINDVVKDFIGTVVAARLWNENSHGVEQWFAMDPDFLAELDALVDPRIPLAHGAGHGGEGVNAVIAGGSWIAHHADRSKTPEENAAIMAAAQERFGKKVVDDEPIGFEAVAQPGRRVNKLDWARRQAEADAGLGGSTFHCNAGIWADVTKLDDVQREGARVFARALAGSIPEVGVTTAQIAAVIRGAFFERIATHVGATGDEAAKRPAVAAWTEARIAATTETYRAVFSRACDLEGFGSAVTWHLEDPARTDEGFRVEKQKAYDRGER